MTRWNGRLGGYGMAVPIGDAIRLLIVAAGPVEEVLRFIRVATEIYSSRKRKD